MINMNGKLMLYKNALICFIGNCQQSDQTVNSYTLQERRGWRTVCVCAINKQLE